MWTYLSLIVGMVAFGFLVYSLLNLERLGIRLTHPRILVELIIFVIFTLLGVYRLVKS